MCYMCIKYEVYKQIIISFPFPSCTYYIFHAIIMIDINNDFVEAKINVYLSDVNIFNKLNFYLLLWRDKFISDIALATKYILFIHINSLYLIFL